MTYVHSKQNSAWQTPYRLNHRVISAVSLRANEEEHVCLRRVC